MAVTADDLFREAFLPLYPADAAEDLAGARARDANPADNPSVVGHLREAAEVFAGMAPRALGHDALLDFSDASVHRLASALTLEIRDRWRAEPGYGTADGTLFNFVIHGAAYLGECALRGRDARWGVRRPLWESVIELRSAAGEARVSVFQIWLKSLSDDALGGAVGGLADRYRTHVEVPTMDAEALPVLVSGERRLPRLSKVRYDTLFKYLRAHLPELEDVGRDFPSPERLDDMRMKWLDAHLVGDGRMLLLAGPGKGGVFLFWLDGQGFVKSAFVPADDFPEPIVTAKDGKIRVVARSGGEDVTHEMLWWGP